MRFTAVTASGASVARQLVGAPDARPVRVFIAGLGSAASVAYLPALADSRLATTGRNLDPGVGSTSAEIASQTEVEFVRDGYSILVADIVRQGHDGDSIMAEWGRTMRRWSPTGLHRTARTPAMT